MKLRITVHGVAYEVDVEVLDAGTTPNAHQLPTGGVHPVATQGPAPVAPAPAAPAPAGAPNASQMAAPLAGLVHALKCKTGDQVKKGQVLLVLEAMKMLTNITAPDDATVQAVKVQAGDSVREGDLLIQFS